MATKGINFDVHWESTTQGSFKHHYCVNIVLVTATNKHPIGQGDVMTF